MSHDSEPLYHDARRSAASIADRCNPLLTWLQTVEEMGDESCSRHSAQKGDGVCEFKIAHLTIKVFLCLCLFVGPNLHQFCLYQAETLHGIEQAQQDCSLNVQFKQLKQRGREKEGEREEVGEKKRGIERGREPQFYKYQQFLVSLKKNRHY